MSEEVLYQINWQIKNDLGTNLFTDKVSRFEEKYEFNINLSVPIFHQDSFTKEKMINYMTIKNVGSGYATGQKRYQVKLPSIKELNKKTTLRLRILNSVSEKIVLNASVDRVSKLSEVDHYLKPVSDISSMVYSRDFFSTQEKINPKLNRYLNLLKDLNLLKKVEDGYSSTSLFSKIRKKSTSPQNFKTCIYSYVLSNAYDTLREAFNFVFIDRYLKIENSYYTDSVESNKLLIKTKPELLESYLQRYARIPEHKFFPDLTELITVKCFEQKNDKILGIDTIYEEFDKQREKEIDFAVLTY